MRRSREVLELIWKDGAETIQQEACEILGVKELREYFRKPATGGFWDDHLKRYSKSRRKAPIYWMLSVPSGSYAIWLYYHRLTDQTLYTVVNRFVEPKLKDVADALAGEEARLPELKGRGANQLRESINARRQLLSELEDFRQELLRIAARPYRPDLNDGVIINAAPLHKLFRHRGWAKECEECWKKLEKGDYDWSHMAYTLWPDRVREKCKHDRSLAIAHGQETLYEAPTQQTTSRRRRKRAEGKVEVEGPKA